MEILWWLAPSVVVTAVAMLWVAWLARDGRGEVDRDQAVERMARALRRDNPALSRRAPSAIRPRDRSTGIAVRPSTNGSVNREDRRPA